MKEVYINNKIQGVIDQLVDLFCLEDCIPSVSIRPRKHNMTGNCTYATTTNNPKIVVGCREGLRLTTLIHELIHAAGYKHKEDINGYSDFAHTHDDDEWRYNKGYRRMTDAYSPLIVKDLFGKREVIL